MADDLLSRAFGALSDPTRRDLTVRLSEGDACVGELAQNYELSLQAVSKHIKVLQSAGLVSRSRNAQQRPVHLETGALSLLGGWLERYLTQAERRPVGLHEALASMPNDPGRP